MGANATTGGDNIIMKMVLDASIQV